MKRIKHEIFGSVFDYSVNKVELEDPDTLQFQISANANAIGRRVSIAVGFLGVGFIGLIQAHQETRLFLVFFALLAAFGVCVLLSVLLQLLKRQNVMIRYGEVEGRYPWLPFLPAWRAPVSSYRGVRWLRKMRQTKQSGRTFTHVVELAHPKRRHSIPLLSRSWNDQLQASMREMFDLISGDAAKSQAALENLQPHLENSDDGKNEGEVKLVWQALARQFDLPAIDARYDREIVHELSDLGKPLQARSNSGEWAETPAPWPLRVTREGEGRAAQLLVSYNAGLLDMIVASLFLLPLAIIVLVLIEDVSLIWRILIVLGGIGFVVLLGWSKPRSELKITRERLVFIGGSDPYKQTQIQLADIEGVQCARRPRELVLSTRIGIRRIAQGLPSWALRWLRDYIEAAIIDA